MQSALVKTAFLFLIFTWLVEVKSLTLPCAAIKKCDFSSLNHSGHQGYRHWLKRLSGAYGEFVLCRMSYNSFGHNSAFNAQYVLSSGPNTKVIFIFYYASTEVKTHRTTSAILFQILQISFNNPWYIYIFLKIKLEFQERYMFFF